METKAPTRTQPALARLALKKVAVARPGATSQTPTLPAPRPHSPPLAQAPGGEVPPAPLGAGAPAPAAGNLLRRALVAELDPGVRNAVVATIPRDRFQIWAYPDGDSAYDHVVQHGADVIILGREMPGLKGTVLCDLLRKGKNGAGLAIILMSPRYTEPTVGAGDCGAFGADEFLPLPATPDVLIDKIEAALVAREPVERLKALPPNLARQVDELFEKLDTLNYYELLEVPIEAERADVQHAFHQRSLLFHPDRHARLKSSLPHAWEKVNTVYKRMSEAYKVLSNPSHRHAYNVAVRLRGAVRFERDPGRRVEEKELELVGTPEGRNFVLQAMECRSFGDLEGARGWLEQALTLEPENQALRDRIDAIAKLLYIVRTQGRP